MEFSPVAKLLLIQSLFVEQFGFMNLSAVSKAKGHEVDLALGSDNHILQKARKFNPDVVGFSVLTGYQQKYLELARTLKRNLKTKPFILFGGPHPTFFPQVIMEDGVDVVCRGEGEGALQDILDAIDNGSNITGIENTVIKQSGEMKIFPMRPLVDLDKLPFPDRNIYLDYPVIYNSDMVTFMASRGCPFSCSFCFNKEMVNMVKDLGAWVRFRSVSNMIEEIEIVRETKAVRNIDFHDDTFIINRKWLFEFLDAYSSKIHIPFSCHIRADLINLDIAMALKDAGCTRVSFGVECGNENIRNLVLKKNIKDSQIREASALLNKVNLPFITYNMLGLPGESLEDAMKTLELNIEIGAEYSWSSIFQPFPGTGLAKYCLEKGYLKDAINIDKPLNPHNTSILVQPDIDKIVRLQKFFYIAIRFPRTLRLIKKLVNYNFPTTYHYIHRMSYLLFYFRKTYQLNWLGTIKHAWIAWRHYG
jgi:radical SAM superfamily enzyme YgiQ (UPF0313 family)